MKKLILISAMAFLAPLCFAQSNPTDSLNCDSIAQKFIGGLVLKEGASEAIMHLYKKNDAPKMDVSLSNEGIQIYCYVCKKENYNFYITKRNNHYMVYFTKNARGYVESALEELLYVRTH